MTECQTNDIRRMPGTASHAVPGIAPEVTPGPVPGAAPSPEAYYGERYATLLAARQQMDDLIEEFSRSRSDSDDLKPVVYHTSRVKSPASLMEKIARKGSCGTTFDDALAVGINDIVGLRVNCAFVDDVYATAAWVRSRDEVEVLNEKDYIAHPKPNGYRSLHLIVRLHRGAAALLPAVEIQLRTIATDFWATLEHKIKYKKTIENPELMQAELKRCADEIAAVDLSMQAIRNVIRDAG
uniref:GTP pyrophosphokinase n=1 Tax=Olsenella uli TaxID=133926 RepID=UPI0028ED64DD|nr:GTP pyrophosphokinase family protein [Olsenella uli]